MKFIMEKITQKKSKYRIENINFGGFFFLTNNFVNVNVNVYL